MISYPNYSLITAIHTKDTTKTQISLNSDVIGISIVNVKASFEEKTLFNTTSLY